MTLEERAEIEKYLEDHRKRYPAAVPLGLAFLDKLMDLPKPNCDIHHRCPGVLFSWDESVEAAEGASWEVDVWVTCFSVFWSALHYQSPSDKHPKEITNEQEVRAIVREMRL